MKNKNYLQIRPRRNRQKNWIRDLISETNILPQNLILPLFVIDGKNKEEKIENLPNVSRLSIDLIIKKIKQAKSLGISAFMLFPVTNPKLKTSDGKEAWNKNNLICKAIKEIKNSLPEIGLICDVALDPYTLHGHDGILNKKNDVDNDKTIELLCKQALVQVEAGCDFIAPSDMMDGRIGVIRDFLDENNFNEIGIVSYAAKYASSFYGPFRSAVGSSINLKKSNKKTYQMDYRNSKEAIREIELDVKQGADAIIIKPAMPYLDLINSASSKFNLPIIGYQVSGEYAMMKFAAMKGAINFDDALIESITCIKRAGASAVITYGAVELLKNLGY
jgi:porphobilinogen synthase